METQIKISQEHLEAAFYNEIGIDELWANYPELTEEELDAQYRKYEADNI